MSSLKAKVKLIQKNESLTIVQFEFNDQALSMMSLELPRDITVGTEVKLTIKPTHIAIGKNISGDLSYSNQLNATIKNIDNGKLLSSISLKLDDNNTIESIITKDSAKRLKLKKGDKVIALIKASDISIGQVCDD
ncbi:MAG: TOBE domain-containing protein [Campylobacterota bacterium]|nr:TOBE domain-containing protein [Campylobacterota bacterium]